MIRVLSIDGGGIRGIIPAAWLMKLEELTLRHTADLFDIMVGTSTGGILALGLACPAQGKTPHSAAALRSLYVDHGAEIFSGRGRRPDTDPAGQAPAAPPRGARYSSEPLRRYLDEYFTDRRLSQALKPVAVVTVDLAHFSGLLFSGGGLGQHPLGDARMSLAALATSSAPTYFEPVRHAGPDGIDRVLVDGGLAANDPAFVALTLALVQQRRAGEDEGILLVSLGTGLQTGGGSLEAGSLAQLAHPEQLAALEPVIQSLYGAPGPLLRHLLAMALGTEYVRVQTRLLPGVDHALDNASPENIRGLQATADALVAADGKRLEELAAKLMISNP
ncbi:patatin-like phospholipase family protein [Arthrobacter sp. Sa2CUA1]|uniref:Patatin-like phospholipase family protein n=1 Tax=Arthrobacter gallicola TaxID=2762225 RepID=A0ABR8UP80_9MICC|nr:patatin-like phospholipase family protein [Arthrobacter gallicola]MBD7994344.1 patatin-like phospholipase family protein [Arthrobacter gallicola]